MPIPTVAYNTNRAAAHAVHRHISRLPNARHLHLQPREWDGRDRREGDYTEWWFIPVRDRSGFQHGRLFVDRVWGPPGKRLPGLLRAGFTVARGFGRQVADMVPPSLALTSGWFWYRFLSDSMAGVFDTPLRAVMANTGQPVTVDLTLYYFDRYPDPGSQMGLQTPNDRMTFEVSDADLTLQVVREGGTILHPLLTATSLRDLILHIEGVPDLTWYWIDVHICAQTWYGDTETPNVWDAAALWEAALAPWLPWVH